MRTSSRRRTDICIFKKFLANAFANLDVRGEPRRTLVRGGRDFFPRTNFLANRSPVRGGVRANPGELGRTPPYSGERSAYSGERSPECRCWRTAGEFARSSREFARVRPSSRRTTVRRVYSQFRLRTQLENLHIKMSYAY